MICGRQSIMHRIYRESLFSPEGQPHSTVKLYTEQELMEEFASLTEGDERLGEVTVQEHDTEEKGLENDCPQTD